MDLSKISIKNQELIVFTALLVVALWKFDMVLDVLKTIWGIIFALLLVSYRISDQCANELLERTIFKGKKKRK